MREELKTIKSEKNELRSFGIVMGVCLLLLGGLLFYTRKNFSIYLIYSSSFFFILSFAAPVVLKPFNKAWMSFAVLLEWIVTRIILAILFYIVCTPLGLITRFMGKDFMRLREKKDSYWIKINKVVEKSQYEKQF